MLGFPIDRKKHKLIRAYGELFRPVSQRVQMNFIFNDNVRILCLSCNVKKVGKLVRFKQKGQKQANFIFTDNVRILYIYSFFNKILY
jgi:hypothetical protein